MHHADSQLVLVRRSALVLAFFAGAFLAAVATRAQENAWEPVGLAGTLVRTLAIDPQTPAILYAAIEGGILRSSDTGRSWEETGYSGNAWMLLVDPVTPTTLYALDMEGAVAKSTDSAASWDDAGNGLDGPVFGLGLDAVEPETLWTADYRFIWRSTNGATTWSQFARPHHGITAFAVSPTRSGVLIGLYRNGAGFWGAPADDAASFPPASVGLATETAPTGYCPIAAAQSPIYSVIGDPSRPAIAYVGYGSGLCKTEDGGSTWRFLPSSVGTRIDFIDPSHPDTLYVFGQDLLRSTDGGQTWAPFEQGFAAEVSVIDLAADANGILYAATNDGIYALGVSETTATPTPTRTPTPSGCAGDCDGNGEVGLGELVLIVSIALDYSAVVECQASDRDRDGSVQISDLLAAVGSALESCAASDPSPTPTPDLEAGFCYESASCFPCDVYPCRPVGMSHGFCCQLSRNGSFSWCPAGAFDSSTNSCAACTHPCR